METQKAECFIYKADIDPDPTAYDKHLSSTEQRDQVQATAPQPSHMNPQEPPSSLSEASVQSVRGSAVAPPHSRQSREPPTSPTPPIQWSDQAQDISTSLAHPQPEELNTIQRQPDTSPRTHEQLVSEVKGIYPRIEMLESESIKADLAQADENHEDFIKELSNKHYQALTKLHMTLLHEHHDFFRASQHPSAQTPLRAVASKYNMPGRMWKYSIHSYLDLLRQRLPGSREHLLMYIRLAFSMMGLLYETVPVYKEAWSECLGDLGRYRMAIEEGNFDGRGEDRKKDWKSWNEISRYWYSKTSDLSPTTGRLYYHLAILARPNRLRQLFYYAKSLCVPNPFHPTRESIPALFHPVPTEFGSPLCDLQEPKIDNAFVQAHVCMFQGKQPELWRATTNNFLGLLDSHIDYTAKLYLEPAYYLGIANSCAVVEYGSESGLLYNIINPLPMEKQAQPEDNTGVKSKEQDSAINGAKGEEEQQQQPPQPTQEPSAEFLQARELFSKTARAIFQRLGDPNIWPFVHVTMVFMRHLTFYPRGIKHLEHDFPWRPFVDLLNALKPDSTKYEDEEFPGLHNDNDREPPRPLPEDFAMRGLLWTDKYYSKDWFSKADVDDGDRYFEVASTAKQRMERILWLGCRIAAHSKWVLYNKNRKIFSVEAEFDDVQEEAKDEDIETNKGQEEQGAQEEQWGQEDNGGRPGTEDAEMSDTSEAKATEGEEPEEQGEQQEQKNNSDSSKVEDAEMSDATVEDEMDGWSLV